MARLAPLALALALAALSAPSASALDVVEVHWGFDGSVAPERFNPLTLRVRHDGQRDFDGALTLTRQSGLGVGGGRHLAPVFLAPGAERWVRLYVYSFGTNETWQLSWRDERGPHALELPPPPAAPPVRVELRPEQDLAGRQGSAARPFSERLFPVTVTATGGLRALVLDRDPSLSAPQRRALLDWVYAGGTLHLVPGPDERLPTLTGDLAPLDQPTEVAVFGSGRIFRHTDAERPVPNRALDAREGPAPTAPSGFGASFGQPVATTAQQTMRLLVRADHAWWAIFLLALVYVVLISVVNGFVGWRWRRDAVAIGLFFGLVVVFGLAFSLIGRRGYGERAALHTIAFVQPVGDGRVAATGYCDLFVTDSGRYRIAHAAPAALYSTTVSNERVDAALQSGPGGAMQTDIPLFSSRAFGFACVVEGSQVELRLVHGTDPPQIALVGEPPPDFVVGYARSGDRVYTLRLDGKRFSPSQDSHQGGQGAKNAFSVHSVMWEFANDDERPDPRRLFRRLGELLIAQHFGDHAELPNPLPSGLPDDAVDVYLIAGAPPGLTPDGLADTTAAYAVYHRRLWRRPQ